MKEYNEGKSEQDDTGNNKVLSFVLNSLGVGIGHADIVSCKMDWNEQARAIIGLDGEQINSPWLGHIHPEDQEAVLSAIQEHINLRKDFNIQYRLLNTQGDTRNLMASIIFPQKTVDSPEVFSVVIDKTGNGHDNLQLAQKIKDQQDFISHINIASPDYIFILDIGLMKIIHANDRISDKFGFDIEYLQQHTPGIFQELLHPDDYERWHAHTTSGKILADGEVSMIEVRMKVKDGNYNWFTIRESVYKRDEKGDVIQLFCIYQDFHQEKSAYENLKQSEMYFRTMVDHTPDSISRWDKDSKLAFSNAEFLRVNGKPEEDLLGKTTLEMGQADNIAIPWMEKLALVFSSGKEQLHYNTFPSMVGGAHFFSRIVPEFSEDGSVKFALAISTDISVLKNASEKIHELNSSLNTSNRQLEAISAELKTLNGIAASDYKETLRKLYTSMEFIVTHDAGNLSNEGRANVRRAQSSIQKLNLLTEDIVEFSNIRVQDEQFSEVDINILLDTVIADFKEKRDVAKINITDDCLPKVHGYQKLLSLLFHHLVDNAIKFRKENTCVNIVISCKTENGDKINNPAAFKESRYNVISISDDGIGFDEKHKENVFKLFTKLNEKHRYKGSGIGLAVCKKVMDLHHGFITAESADGEGTTFRCYFPS